MSKRTGELPPCYGLKPAENVLLGLCIAYCLYANACSLPDPDRSHLAEPMRTFGDVVRLQQHWDLFGPLPPVNGWFILEATLDDGSRVDLFHNGQPVDFTRPSDPSAMFPSHRWKMLMDNTLFHRGESFRANLSRYWARQHPPARPILRLRYLFQVEEVDWAGLPRPPETLVLWDGSP